MGRKETGKGSDQGEKGRKRQERQRLWREKNIVTYPNL